jgi:hypothetical protein
MTTWGFNFRATSGYVTDGAGQSPVLGEVYPNVYSNGLTAGFVAGVGGIVRDRDNAIDVRLAGINGQFNDGASQDTFRVTLPSSGNYTIALAIGDMGSDENYQYVVVKDGSTTLFSVIAPLGTVTDDFIDATGTHYSAAAWPGSNTPVSVTMSGTTLNVVIGSPDAQANVSTIAHLSITSVGSSSTNRMRRIHPIG